MVGLSLVPEKMIHFKGDPAITASIVTVRIVVSADPVRAADLVVQEINSPCFDKVTILTVERKEKT